MSALFPCSTSILDTKGQITVATPTPIFTRLIGLITAGDWDCVAVVERLLALHYSVDFIFMSFGIMRFFWEL